MTMIAMATPINSRWAYLPMVQAGRRISPMSINIINRICWNW